jgi:hypothetical protein
MQNRLIKLYVVNLQSIGTQAAFIAGFSFLGSSPLFISAYFSVTLSPHSLTPSLCYLSASIPSALPPSPLRYWFHNHAKNWFQLAWLILSF